MPIVSSPRDRHRERPMQMGVSLAPYVKQREAGTGALVFAQRRGFDQHGHTH